jgi:hypothetical protein
LLVGSLSSASMSGFMAATAAQLPPPKATPVNQCHSVSSEWCELQLQLCE